VAFLSPYRVLDLSDERGLLAGHMLAQLGADVVQVEGPGGLRLSFAASHETLDKGLTRIADFMADLKSA